MLAPAKILILFLALWACAARANAASDWLADLQSPNIDTRRAAIDEIQTLDDPRIPSACLPLLQDTGDSIRRQAARAIGSRFDQIPGTEKPAYVQALKACASNGPADVTLLCQRAIGLLTQDYKFPAFSVSPNGKWVLYERRRLPVIANIQTQTHILLSPCDSALAPDDPLNDQRLLKMKVTNEPAADLFIPHWQNSGDAVAFTLETLEMRFYHPICVWCATDPDVHVLDVTFFQSLLGSRYPDWGTTTDFAGWKGDKVLVRVYNCDDPDTGRDPNDPGLICSYDIRTKKIALEN